MSPDQNAHRGAGQADEPAGKALDPVGLRAVLGRFATGVAVMTGRDAGDLPVGITVNSFTSLSLDPPFILWCVAVGTHSGERFQPAEPFVVNILNSGQTDVAKRFADAGNDKFAGLSFSLNEERVPVLHDCGARLECVVEARYPGGDHAIIVGRVLRYQQAAADPLVFYGGKFRSLRGISMGEAPDMLLGFQ